MVLFSSHAGSHLFGVHCCSSQLLHNFLFEVTSGLKFLCSEQCNWQAGNPDRSLGSGLSPRWCNWQAGNPDISLGSGLSPRCSW